MNCSYLDSDYQSLEFHKLVAKKLRADPGLIDQALNNIRRWKKQNLFPQPYLDGWLDHIEKGMDHLLFFMVSETDEAQRMRSSGGVRDFV